MAVAIGRIEVRLALNGFAPRVASWSPVEAALGVTVSGLVEIITAMLRTVAALEKHLAETFAQHPLAPVLTSVAGLGPILAARVLAEIGDDPVRFSSANGLRAFAGTAPVTRASDKLLGQLWWCLRTEQLWDDNAAWPQQLPRSPVTAAA